MPRGVRPYTGMTAMAARAPWRMKDPSGSWLVRVARCMDRRMPPQTAASANPANVPTSRGLPAGPAEGVADVGRDLGVCHAYPEGLMTASTR